MPRKFITLQSPSGKHMRAFEVNQGSDLSIYVYGFAGLPSKKREEVLHYSYHVDFKDGGFEQHVKRGKTLIDGSKQLLGKSINSRKGIFMKKTYAHGTVFHEVVSIDAVKDFILQVPDEDLSGYRIALSIDTITNDGKLIAYKEITGFNGCKVYALLYSPKI